MNTAAVRLRPAPPFILGAGLLLWGWQTGYFWYALPMALLLESPRWTGWRWPISDQEFNALSDISGVAFFLLAVYVFTTDGAGGIFVILSIMPFILFLLVSIQRFSERGCMKLSALFLSLRRLEPGSDMDRDIDLTLPYFLLCILSASAGNRRDLGFFILSSVLLIIVLWSFRPRRYHFGVWAGLVGLSIGIAFGGQLGLQQLHRSIEQSVMQLFEQYMWRYRDPDRATTAIGSLGRLKLSDRIVLRVYTDGKLTRPLLLREATYANYGFGVWSNNKTRFDLIDPDITPGNWTLAGNRGGHSVAISKYMIRSTAVIPLPMGTTNIRNSTAVEIDRNAYGAVKMENRKGWIRYRVDFRPGAINDSPPAQEDLFIGSSYRADFRRLAQEWKLYDKTPREIVATVKRNFAEKFRYSLTQRNRYPRGRYLHNFLFVNRRGHCEYFATATVLLLRAAGIPARYAVGYVTDEFSRLEGNYVVRARDAHSWAMAWVDGGWHVIDTTPPVWASAENANAPALEPLFDFISWLKYRFARWQAADEPAEASSNSYLLWLLVPLVLLLIWRLYGKERIHRNRRERATPPPAAHPGMDSALYRLIRELEQTGHRRRPGETLGAWFDRLDVQVPAETLHEALQLHYRYRFDPEADTRELRRRLTERVNTILATGLIAPAGGQFGDVQSDR